MTFIIRLFSCCDTALLVVAVFPIRRLLALCIAPRVLRDLLKFITGQHTRTYLKIIHVRAGSDFRRVSRREERGKA